MNGAPEICGVRAGRHARNDASRFRQPRFRPLRPSPQADARFPAPVTILTFVLILVWIAAFFIPSGQYKLDAGGSPIPGSFRNVAPPLDFDGRLQDLLLAPVNGMYGIRDPDTGHVGPFNKGTMFGSIEVFLFILSIGGFMTVVFATGALESRHPSPVLPIPRARPRC